MCGLVGFSKFAEGTPNVDKILQLLYINSLTRGKDATGFYTTGSGVIKAAKNATEFITALYKNFDADLKQAILNSNVFIGHVRQKTTGEKTDKNAHPFQFNNIVGAHNGVVNNYKNLIKNEDTFPYDVDSMVIFARLSQDNNYSVLEEMDAAAALIFHDTTDPNTLYVYRNIERPLFKGRVENSGLYFSSIPESLTLIGCTDVEEIKPHYVYKYTNGIYQSCKKIISKIKPTLEALKSIYSQDLSGFNLLLEDTISNGPLSGKLLYFKERARNADNSISTYQWSCITQEGEAVKAGSSWIDVNSYNGYFQKGTIVQCLSRLTFSTNKKNNGRGNKKKEERVAAYSGELFKIIEPLTTRLDRKVTMQSIEDPTRQSSIVDVSYLRIVSEITELCDILKERNIPMSPEIKFIIEGPTNEDLDNIATDLLEKSAEFNLAKKLGAKSGNLHRTLGPNILDPTYDADLEQELNDRNNDTNNQYEIAYKYIDDSIIFLRKIKSELPVDNELSKEAATLLTDSNEAQQAIMNLYEQFTISIPEEDGFPM